MFRSFDQTDALTDDCAYYGFGEWRGCYEKLLMAFSKPTIAFIVIDAIFNAHPLLPGVSWAGLDTSATWSSTHFTAFLKIHVVVISVILHPKLSCQFAAVFAERRRTRLNTPPAL